MLFKCPLKLAVSFFLFSFCFSCARSLKEDKDITELPDELKQEIVEKKIKKDLKKTKEAKTPKKSLLKKVFSSGEETPKGILTKKKRKIDPALTKDWPFGVGERLEYVIRYGPIEGGLASIEFKGLKSLKGTSLLHYKANAKSFKFFDFFYKVDDTLETWVRARDHLPIRQEIKLKESGQWGRRVVLFDQEKKHQKYYSHVTRSSGKVKIKKKEGPLKRDPQDLLSAFYYYRFFKKLDALRIPVHDRWKHWNLDFIFQKTETVKVKAGTFQCRRYKLNPRLVGRLERKGDFLAWITDDERKLLVKFKSKIKVGSITGELKSYKKAAQNLTLEFPELTTRYEYRRK